MKRLSTILGQPSIYLNAWADGGKEKMLRDFEIKKLESGTKIILASYGTPAYEGYAFVLFSLNGKLYEVDGSHCSCYGLEGQWEPDGTTLEEIIHRLIEGKLGQDDDNPFGVELMKLLGIKK